MRFSAHGFFIFWTELTKKIDKMASEKSGNSNSENSVHSVENNGSVPRTLPNSKKVYLNGKLHVDLRVPFREIALAPDEIDGR